MEQPRKIYIPPEGPPQGRNLSPEIYQKMGSDNIFKMVGDFYLELEKSSIRHMFPEDMLVASERSAKFFVFLLGGPPLYQQDHGNPMMRQRHLPFSIDEASRQVWLSCFKSILKEAEVNYHFPKEHIGSFILFLERFSAWMVNTQ